MEKPEKCHLVSAGAGIVDYARKRNEAETNKLIDLSSRRDEKERKLREKVIDALCKAAEMLGW